MTGRAFVLLLIAASTLYAASNVGVGWLYALGYTLVSGVVSSAAFGAMSLRGIRLSVSPGLRTEAGTPLPVAVTLENLGSRSRRMLCLLAPPLGGASRLWPWRRTLLPEGWGSVLIPELRPGERLTVQLPVPAPRRGVHRLPALTLQAAPLGLVAWTRRVAAAPGLTAVVHPRMHPLTGWDWLTRREGRGETAAASHAREGGEVAKTVRPYRSGDALRQIHWKATARKGELTVRENEGEAPSRGLVVYLDRSELREEAFETAVEAAASLLGHAARQGVEARLYSQTGEPTAQTLIGQLDWLARLSDDGATGPPSPSWSAEGAVVVTSRKHAWEGRAEACIHVPPGASIDEVLRA